jgi:hypothetical protein
VKYWLVDIFIALLIPVSDCIDEVSHKFYCSYF